MTFRRFLAFVLTSAMLLGMTACGTAPVESTPSTQETVPTTTTEPTAIPTEPDPAELYAQAAERLNTATDLVLNITTERTLDIGGEVFTEASQQELHYTGLGSDSFSAWMEESVDYDGYSTTYDEVYQDGTLYVTIGGTYYFQGSVTAEDYTSRFAPPVMLDADLYGEITGDGSVISFASPTAGESWLVPDYAELVTAGGTATLSGSGEISAYTYSVTYAIGGAQITYDISAEIGAASGWTVSPAQNIAYTELEYVDSPRLIVQTSGYLYQSAAGHAVTSTVAESVVSYAGGVIRNQSSTINCWGSGSKYMADLELSIYQMSAYGEDSYEQEEHFQDGVYTYSADGSEPEENSGVSAIAFMTYCQSFLTANIPSLEWLTGAYAEDLGSLYYLELSFANEMGDSFNQYISELFWGDGDFLNDLASAYETTAVDVYLALDKYTGLPTAVGLYYEGFHTIDGDDYLLSYQSDQSFDLASTSAYETIAEEAPPAAEPEEKATPLFYHVTGPDGQEMWLLGTIHVGDERTSYLPQEIYDAFDAADALAVEFNSEAFSDALDEDEDLSDQVSDCYFYDDGTTQDHIEDQELYEYALKLMKASGNYHMNAPYLKAYLWSSSIDNFYLRQGYSLRSSQGVDNQLIWRAEAQDKTILDVESGLFQIQMLTGFSDALQEELLLESAATDPLEYVSGTQELFEMWCAGDEAALIEYLNTEADASELTEEELALVEEYNNAMGTDRNDDMLDVAIGYLESGDVVFFAVGLAHLLAEDGLVNTLRDAGYTVELVSYDHTK